ncbi:M23 family metallopeptidase [Vulgatibacter incomptus]|uniref:M23ase beta-sheet core domain-containing protein n=1 Tax=Vulgatibacter incomptus TaxID=1391653 RepID=A0A0K1PG96_9BACT|nr:M23 family metallopeptidase [Vulgatibacter incomptus]AKU92540.1 hypothetical protein AKJ08_2927 [Vulgatibacter incomptus]
MQLARMLVSMSCAALALLPGCATAPARGEATSRADDAESIEAVVVHPIFASRFETNEHWAGQVSEPGDALGSDCVVARLVEENGRLWLRKYRGDGARNEDWYGWRREVLSPISGEVVKIHENPKTNEPGVLGEGMATIVELQRADGVHVWVVHLQEIRVQVGDRVAAGQPIGLVGNNGQSRHPHIHVGAWRDGRPLQIRFDLKAIAELAKREIDQ